MCCAGMEGAVPRTNNTRLLSSGSLSSYYPCHNQLWSCIGQCTTRIRELTPVEVREENICGGRTGQERLMRAGAPQFSATVKCRL